MLSKGAGSSFAVTPFSFLSAILTNVSLTKVDFPEPETPVTTIKQPTGNLAVIFLRLLPLQPFRVKNFPFLGLTLFLGTGIYFLPRYIVYRILHQALSS